MSYNSPDGGEECGVLQRAFTVLCTTMRLSWWKVPPGLSRTSSA